MKSIMLVTDCIWINLLFQNLSFSSRPAFLSKDTITGIFGNCWSTQRKLRSLNNWTKNILSISSKTFFHLLLELLTHLISRDNLSLLLPFLVQCLQIPGKWNGQWALLWHQSSCAPAALALLRDIFDGVRRGRDIFKQHGSTEAHPGVWQWENSVWEQGSKLKGEHCGLSQSLRSWWELLFHCLLHFV